MLYDQQRFEQNIRQQDVTYENSCAVLSACQNDMLGLPGRDALGMGLM